MELILETLMLLSFLAALCCLIVRLANHRIAHYVPARAAAITMGIGFLFGAASKVLAGPFSWTFFLYVLGAMLSYTAVLFSIPASTKQTR